MYVYMLTAIVLLPWVLSAVSSQHSSSKTYCVNSTNNSTTKCPPKNDGCMTLSQYANKTNTYFDSGSITLLLLPGNHSLNLPLDINSSKITFLNISTYAPGNTTTTVTVICSQSARFKLERINTGHISISGIEWVGCVNNSISSVESFILRDCTFNCNDTPEGSGLLLNSVKNATVRDCSFSSASNSAIMVDKSKFEISNCIFVGNEGLFGGAVYALQSNARIENSTFRGNSASMNGGALGFDRVNETQTDSSHEIHLNGNEFVNNSAGSSGGAVYIFNQNVNISSCKFSNNSAMNGGALYVEHSLITMTKIFSCTLWNTYFTRNSATSTGAAIYVDSADVYSDGYLTMKNNVAHLSIVYLVHSTASLAGQITISDNSGSIFAFSSNVSFSGDKFSLTNGSLLNGYSQEGGALTSVQSSIYFRGLVELSNNEAQNGGAIVATESVLYMSGDIKMFENAASMSGGGIYAYRSELNFGKNVKIEGNIAKAKNDSKGGGIYAIDSTINLLNGSLQFIENRAEKGGGVCLEVNAKIYVIKSDPECNRTRKLCKTSREWIKLEFSDNSAQYGGAVYVSDFTNYGTCFVDPSSHQYVVTECFFQVIASYVVPKISGEQNIQNIFFTNNTGAGGTLFGGLLDRCTISPFSEFFLKYSKAEVYDGISYLLNVSNLVESDLNSVVSSGAVRVCFCRYGKPDCNYQPLTVQVMKGTPFLVTLVAVDQVNNTVPYSTIHGSLSSGQGGLSEGQSSQLTNKSCTKLLYNVFSPLDDEVLTLYAEGPCNNTGEMSQAKIYVKSLPCQCPLGFVYSGNPKECNCTCDPDLSQYITKCFWENETLLREGDFWIVEMNDTIDNATLIYPHCPFDYCYPPTIPVYINLNIPNGSDAQCAFNRSGVLCGSCQEGLSLSLGSSRCMPCSNSWLALLIPFAIAGIALVAFLLFCNLTVYNGTINGLIFYANIIAANRATFLPIDKANIVTVFIAWLNLDFGFETCFYDGMDGYVKVWLQLAFPVYLIVLVVVVMYLSGNSEAFTRILIKRKPVATLATLILLSYTKLLRTIIAALSFATLEYPDGSQEIVWRYDGELLYLEGKHIALFVVAILIIMVGLAYTLLLFSWQWLLKFSNWGILKWCNNTRLKSFMDVYHAPYKDEHKYWTGLLLFLRVPLYIVSAVDFTIGVNLFSTIFVVGFILLLKTAHRTYKTWCLDFVESFFIFNLLVFSTATFYVQQTNGDQTVLAYTLIIIALLTFVYVKLYISWNPLKRWVRVKWGNSRFKVRKLTKKSKPVFENVESEPAHKFETSGRSSNYGQSVSMVEINPESTIVLEMPSKNGESTPLLNKEN